MFSKPFKPLTIRSPSSVRHKEIPRKLEPPPKRRRIATPDVDDDQSDLLAAGTSSHPGITSASTAKIVYTTNTNPNVSKPRNEASRPVSEYYSVLWRNFTTKKNKTWDDDGVLAIKNAQATLYNSSGIVIGLSAVKSELLVGSILSIGGKDVEVVSTISEQEFRITAQTKGHANEKPRLDAEKHLVGSVSIQAGFPIPGFSSEKAHVPVIARSRGPKPAAANDAQASIRKIHNEPFRQPLKENTVLPQIPSEMPIPRHDPNSPGAMLFDRPKHMPKDSQLVDVVLDPLLGKNLRDHQREGVKFLYECVMDHRSFGGQGCILADDMGLGKTLQAISLLWTLIKQNPIHKAPPVVRKALVVCPVSLIKNWKKEFKKWLGSDRLGVLEFEDQKTRLSMFDGKAFNVMIIGYERLRMVAEDLAKGSGIDIVICDEGHRLKTIKNKSAKAIESLNTTRRVILSGTPIQNDLGEFYAMVNFVNDGCLGSQKGFLKNFETPIMKSRQPGASEAAIERGEAASEELAEITSPFILRRTTDILAKFLPRKTEYVLFCKPTSDQASIYRQVVQSPIFQSAIGSNEAALQLISILKKLCNSPALMRTNAPVNETSSSSSLASLNAMLPPGVSKNYHNSASAKIRILDQLLQQIQKTTEEKVVLVSNYTSTLDLMENLLVSSGFSYSRLDGTVPASKRQGLVDTFNRARPSHIFAFLLSAKAGGVGINLTGASRLILFDVDWNPATDDQAMARIYRQGQKNHCRIYRFLVKGSIEERIWQRQIVKRGLADSIMEGRANLPPSRSGATSTRTKIGKATFSQEELRDLFRFDENEGLRTHDLIGCRCHDSNSHGIFSDGSLPLGQQSTGEQKLQYSEERQISLDITEPVKASQLIANGIDDQERSIRLGTHPKQAGSTLQEDVNIQELLSYTHLDTRSVSGLDIESKEFEEIESLVDDSCLMNVLGQSRELLAGGVPYLFKKAIGPVLETSSSNDEQNVAN